MNCKRLRIAVAAAVIFATTGLVFQDSAMARPGIAIAIPVVLPIPTVIVGAPYGGPGYYAPGYYGRWPHYHHRWHHHRYYY